MPSEISQTAFYLSVIEIDVDISGKGKGHIRNPFFNLLFSRVFVKIYQFVFKIHCSKWDKTGKLTFM
ncbi:MULTISPECIES: hypothetical protein [Neisseria]|uniref:hypothetical protein n=1 Tax=Neisseria TaxID=482 RepID=UPI001C55C4C2|nr:MULTISPECIES: hypothetical protein [Neisseria]MBW3899928.1 hypothetical protein [Neisseria meningitidis]MBW3906010.1 hypothetical protein [Neisseria meningitidis]